MSRNYAVKNILQDAFERMEMLSDLLDIWIVVKLAPEAAMLKVFMPDPDEATISVALSAATRNARTVLNDDHMVVTVADGTVGKIPYDGIYCLATTGTLASVLEWNRHTDDDEDVAYVNLVTPGHDMLKYQQTT